MVGSHKVMGKSYVNNENTHMGFLWCHLNTTLLEKVAKSIAKLTSQLCSDLQLSKNLEYEAFDIN